MMSSAFQPALGFLIGKHFFIKEDLGALTSLVFGLFTLEIFHLSLKDSLLFNKFNSFNVNMKRFQTIYLTNIV